MNTIILRYVTGDAEIVYMDNIQSVTKEADRNAIVHFYDGSEACITNFNEIENQLNNVQDSTH